MSDTQFIAFTDIHGKKVAARLSAIATIEPGENNGTRIVLDNGNALYVTHSFDEVEAHINQLCEP